MERVLRRVWAEVVQPGASPLARDWLMHALGCACLALRDPDCAPLLGPPVPGATLPLGARVPGTSLELDPASAAFNLGAMIRGETAGPADHVAAVLAAADYAARRAHYDGVAPPTVGDLLAGLHRAETLARALARDDRGRDDPWLCQRAADAFVATGLLGGSVAQQFDAAVRASLDGSPAAAAAAAAIANRGARREQRRAAGENAARALRHALAVLREAPPAAAAAQGAAAREGAAATEDADAAGVAALAPPRPAPPALDSPCPGTGFAAAVAALYPPPQAAAIVALFGPAPGLEALAVDAFVARLVRN